MEGFGVDSRRKKRKKMSGVFPIFISLHFSKYVKSERDRTHS